MLFFESEKTELKTIINDSLAKEIEAFLNTDGGNIYIGVDDTGFVIGIDNIDQYLRKISDIVSDQIEPNAIDCVRTSVIENNDRKIIQVAVTKGNQSLYCIKKYGYSSNGCHYRIGTSCKSMTLEMIRTRLEVSFAEVDIMLKSESCFQDLSFTRIKVMLMDKGYHIEPSTFERNFKLLTSTGSYNALAELISDNNSTPFIFVKFNGINRAALSERIDYGNQCIVLAYEQMKDRLIVENRCKTITNPRPRKDIYLYDMYAVNEALVNAIIHNDYMVSDPQVALFKDRIEITSHGGLPSGLTRKEFFAGISKPRNRQLMGIFSRLGIVEHTGHGVPTIVNIYGTEAFTISSSYIRVTIPFNIDVMSSYNVDKPDILSTKERYVLDTLKENPNSSAQYLSDQLCLPSRSIQRYLADLKEKGIIERIGAKKNGYWKINEEK